MAEQKLIGIYCLTSPDGKVYVGQSTDLRARYGSFFYYRKTKTNSYRGLEEAVSKYPRKQWRHEILQYCSKEELDELEEFWIKELDATNPERGYNKELGGRGCPKPKRTEEARERMSKAHKGKVLSEETKRKLSESKLGCNNYKSKAVNQYDKSGRFIQSFCAASVAGRVLGVNQSHISACCLGKRKSAGGYRWEYT
jgi:group I intron endonuclease